MPKKKLNIAVVGLGFGAEFIPIWQRHPDTVCYAICQRDPKKLKAIGDAFDVSVRYTDFREMLKDPNIDAVHINSPGSWLDVHRGVEGRQACGLHGAHGHQHRGLQKDL
jgi:hypothetical protein